MTSNQTRYRGHTLFAMLYCESKFRHENHMRSDKNKRPGRHDPRGDRGGPHKRQGSLPQARRFAPPAHATPAPATPPPETPAADHLAASVDIPAGTPRITLRSASYGAFIYQKMIGHVDSQARDGDVVAVVDKRGQFFGWGFFNSRSQIGLRMISHGGPKPDEAFFAARIAQAVQLRREVLRLDETTDAYRLIHAEGDNLSGLIVDRFGQYVAIELFSLAMYRRIEMIKDAIVDAGVSVKDFVVRADKLVAEQEGFRATGLPGQAKDAATIITENGVKFHVDLSRGHKTGFFCDQRDNRLALTTLTPGKRVLDVCCYSGGFSCYAAAKGNAAAVTAVDLDEKAIEMARRNAALNAVHVEFRHADAFDFLREVAAAGQKWDVVIVDPSKFVARRDQIDIGLRKYADLNRLAAGVVRSGGILLTCSCSGLVDVPTFTQTVSRALRTAGRPMQMFRISSAGADHPVMGDTPEASYLKAIWARL